MKFVEKGVAIFFILIMTGSLILVCNFESAKATDPLVVQWTQIYEEPPNETAMSVVQTSDGGYAIAGANSSTNTQNLPTPHTVC